MNDLQIIDPGTLLNKAVESNASIETLERLLAMRKDIKEEFAKDAYYTAMSGFQGECPVIKKTKEVHNKNSNVVRYRYAPLDSIITQVQPLLDKYGFSWTFKVLPGKEEVKVCCEAHHLDGHSEDSCFVIPIDPDAYMTDAQKSGSASTFAKRYAFCNVFGIATGDDDDDGTSAGRENTANDLYRKFNTHMRATFENIDTILAMKKALLDDDLDSAAEAWAEIDDYNVISALSLAPTKGGCFTVAERKQMETKEFKDALIKFRDGRELKNV